MPFCLFKECIPRRYCGILLQRRLKRCVIIVCCCCLVLFILTGLSVYKSTRMCSDNESKQYLHDLCTAYVQDLITGALCQDLCNTEKIKFVKCLNYRHGKVILEMDYEGLPLVLKTQNVETPEWKTLWYVLGSAIYPTMDDFKDLVFRELYSLIANAHRQAFNQDFKALQFEENQNGAAPNFFLQTNIFKGSKRSFAKNFTKENILNEITGLQLGKYDLIEINFAKRLTKSALMDSVWSVVQQSEYVFMKINQDWKYIPQIYGTCGTFYGMEYLNSGPTLENDLEKQGDNTAIKRIDIALQMLEMIREMDSWQPHPLHMCDVKLENFGLSSSTGQLYTIDVDMFFFNDKMEKEIMVPEKCVNHQDCDFFDCKGWCDMSTGTCHKIRINNNLQAVCEKIFKSSFFNAYHGLLHSLPPPFNQQLDQLLPECTHPLDSPDPKVPGKAPESVAGRLKSLLQEAKKFITVA